MLVEAGISLYLPDKVSTVHHGHIHRRLGTCSHHLLSRSVNKSSNAAMHKALFQTEGYFASVKTSMSPLFGESLNVTFSLPILFPECLRYAYFKGMVFVKRGFLHTPVFKPYHCRLR